jgi:integrase
LESNLREVESLKRSAVHLSDLRGRYEAFCADFGDRMTRTLTHQEIRAWINGLELSDLSKNNFRDGLSSLFRFGEKEGYLDADPCAKIECKKIKAKPPVILTVDALSTLLEASDAEILPMVAIGSFAGLRTAELMRLNWDDVSLVTGLIKVGDSKNTSSRRFVPIQRNLAQCLAPYSGLTGPV